MQAAEKLVYILYSAGGCGGVKDDASTGMKNNVKPKIGQIINGEVRLKTALCVVY